MPRKTGRWPGIPRVPHEPVSTFLVLESQVTATMSGFFCLLNVAPRTELRLHVYTHFTDSALGREEEKEGGRQGVMRIRAHVHKPVLQNTVLYPSERERRGWESADVPSGNGLLSQELRSCTNFVRVLIHTRLLTTPAIQQEPRYFSVMLVEFHSVPCS